LGTMKLLALALLVGGCLFGQGQAFIQTIPPPGARFEIIQRSVRDTFKLDRFSGEVYMRIDAGGKEVWALTQWLDKPIRATFPAPEPRFQVLMGTQVVGDTFLLDLTTGQTWIWAIISGDQSTASFSDEAWVLMRDVAVEDKKKLAPPESSGPVFPPAAKKTAVK
jgi:hypothetical protein